MENILWHLRGSVALNGNQDSALDGIEGLLGAQYKTVIERGSDHVSFDDPLWRSMFVPNWLAMLMYDRGHFWTDNSQGTLLLYYDLRSLHGMLFCMFAAGLAFFFGMADQGLQSGLAYAAFAFVWLYGVNMLLALIRVPRAIREAVRE